MVGRIQTWMQNDYLTSVFWDEHEQLIDAALEPILHYILDNFSPPEDTAQGAISQFLIPMHVETYQAHLPAPPETPMRRQRKLTILLMALATFDFVVQGITTGNLKLNSKIGFHEWLANVVKPKTELLLSGGLQVEAYVSACTSSYNFYCGFHQDFVRDDRDYQSRENYDYLRKVFDHGGTSAPEVQFEGLQHSLLLQGPQTTDADKKSWEDRLLLMNS